jgi:hypothetical protein
MRNRFRRNCATVFGAAKAVNVRQCVGRDLNVAFLLIFGDREVLPSVVTGRLKWAR